MINSLNPPWIHPKPGEFVRAYPPLRSKWLNVTYDFKNHTWLDNIGEPIEIYGWYHHGKG